MSVSAVQQRRCSDVSDCVLSPLRCVFDRLCCVALACCLSGRRSAASAALCGGADRQGPRETGGADSRSTEGGDEEDATDDARTATRRGEPARSLAELVCTNQWLYDSHQSRESPRYRRFECSAVIVA